MRVIVIDPDVREIFARDINPTKEVMENQVGGWVIRYHVTDDKIPDHAAYVNEMAILERLEPWKFGGVMVWGPMIICKGKLGEIQPAEITLEEVEKLVDFGHREGDLTIL